MKLSRSRLSCYIVFMLHWIASRQVRYGLLDSSLYILRARIFSSSGISDASEGLRAAFDATSVQLRLPALDQGRKGDADK